MFFPANLAAPFRIGTYPTPIERISTGTSGELWVKRDDLTAPRYGGNKVRKLEYLLADAKAKGCTRIVTVGAIGSHHVLATSIYAREAGLETCAILYSQPITEHVEKNTRALDLALSSGLTVIHANQLSLPLHAFIERHRANTYYATFGGSSPVGALGYVDAARELADQVRAGEMPEPDAIVVALGSGGTAAGLAVGLARENIRTSVIGVTVAKPAFALHWVARRLARKVAALIEPDRDAARALGENAIARLRIDASQVGDGYGHSTKAGNDATARAREFGLALDPTYTAKTFAAALTHADDDGTSKVILYWHTLSSAPPPAE